MTLSRFSYEDLSGKAKCKLNLQRELGLRANSKTPLIGYIGRLDEQKGSDLVLDAVPWLMANRCQLVMLGTGDVEIEERMKQTEKTYKSFNRAFE